MASDAAVTLPTESVVLVSTSCLKISCESFSVSGSSGDFAWAKRDAAGSVVRKREAARRVGASLMLEVTS